MLKTNTEDLNNNLNYFSTSKNVSEASESYTSALKNIINIFCKQVSNGEKTEEEIADFGQMLSIVQYFDKPIIGIDKLAEYYDRTITSSKENYIEKTNSKMVA